MKNVWTMLLGAMIEGVAGRQAVPAEQTALA